MLLLTVLAGCPAPGGSSGATGSLPPLPGRPLAIADLPGCPAPPVVGSARDRADLAELLDRQTRRTAAARTAFDRWQSEGLPLAHSARTDEWLIEGRFVPPRAARALAMVHVAMHDALLAAARDQARYRRGGPWLRAPRLATADVRVSPWRYPSERAVVAGAWEAVMVSLLPDASASITREAAEAVEAERDLGISTASDLEAGLALGREVGARVVRLRADDGAAQPATGSLVPAPGRWGHPAAMEPHAGSWRPWWIGRGDRFRLAGIATASEALQTELEEVRREVESLERFPWKLDQASYWNFDVPAILWSQEARRLLRLRPTSDLVRARVLAELATTQADAFISAWDTKYTVLRPRPAMLDSGLQARMPFATPPHPSFPSGHAVASAAGAWYLSQVFPGEQRHLNDLANQAAMSRLYAGIHFASDNLAGLDLGRRVGQAVLEALPEPPPVLRP
jgi:hypothetical protein